MNLAYECGKLLRITIPLLAISFVVGLGGQYYNHHYIFALPMYALFLLNALNSIINRLSDESCQFSLGVSFKDIRFPVLILLISLCGINYLPNFQYNQTILSYSESNKKNAEYFDKIMDLCKRERYQYFGFNGPVIYAYTEHDPMGPVFFQDPRNFDDEESFFAKSLKRQMLETDIYVYQHNYCGEIAAYVDSYIMNNFTLIAPVKEVIELTKPNSFNYLIYYRKAMKIE